MMGQNFFDDAYATIIKNGNKNGERTFRCEENWAVGVAVVTCLQKVVLVIIEEKKGRTYYKWKGKKDWKRVKEEKKESQMKMKERKRKVKQNPKNECVKLKLILFKN